MASKGVETNAANRTSAPHMRLADLLASSTEHRGLLAAIDAPGSAIYHAHAKDAFINKPVCAPTSRLENDSLTDIPGRAWSYITLGYGNGESWWRGFCYRLRMAGYDGWLASEHEDVMLSREEGVLKSVRLLQDVAPSQASDYKPQAI